MTVIQNRCAQQLQFLVEICLGNSMNDVIKSKMAKRTAQVGENHHRQRNSPVTDFEMAQVETLC